MTRAVFVDGHNVMQVLRIGGSDHAERRRRVLRLVASLHVDATVFFDARGAPPDAPDRVREEGVRVRYCRHRAADEAIVEAVIDQVRPHRVTVVSSDRELLGRCAAHGAGVTWVRAFFRPALERPHPPEPKPTGRGGFRASDFGLPDEIDLDDPGDALSPRRRD